MAEHPTILLAEDDDNDVFFFVRAVRETSIANRLCIVRDGQETIDYLAGRGKYADRAAHPLPCLLVLDLKMPRKTGMEVLQWLQGDHSLRSIPVMVFSSSAQPEDIDRAYGFGANAFVVKPVSLESRAELARLIDAFWLKFNQPPNVCRTHRLVPLNGG